jgi:uncharacterized membrane protein
MWSQTYNPLGNATLSTLMAALPVVVLLGLIASNKVKAHVAAIVALIVANLVAIYIFTMPAGLAIRASALGAVIGFFPIGWIVLNVIFLYRLTVERGAFETLQTAIGNVTADRRLQLLLIAFAFGAFFEGASGFGTPVAVTGAILIGLGFSPLAASGLSLIANTAPVAYGALGTPIAGLSSVTGIDPYLLGAMVGRQLPFFSLIVPFWLIWVFAGFRGMMQVWPAILVTGVSFAIPQFLISNYINHRCLVGLDGMFAHIPAGLVAHGNMDFARPARPRHLDKRGCPGSCCSGITDIAPSVVRVDAVDHRLRRCSGLGDRLVQGGGQSVCDLELPGPGPPQSRTKSAASCCQAHARGRCVLVHMAVLHGLRHVDCGHRVWLADGVFASASRDVLRQDDQRRVRITCYDHGHVGHRHADTHLGNRRHTRSRICRNRGALPLLRNPTRLARGSVDRLRHGLERAIRQSAEGHVGAIGTATDPHGGGQFFGRCHG